MGGPLTARSPFLSSRVLTERDVMKQKFYAFLLILAQEILTRLPYHKRLSLILDKLLLKVERYGSHE